MNRKLITKIAASAASLTLVAGAMVAPAGSALSNLTTMTTSMAAFENYYSSNLDSTGTFYVKLNNDYVENGVSRGTEAQITGVVASKIPASGILTIPSRITVSGKNYDGKKFEPVTVPVTEIGPSAFIRQKSLISVNFPSTVKKIGYYAFENSGLVSLDLPSTITGIASGAFRNCDGLYNVNFKCSQPSIKAFEDCDNLTSFNNSPILTHNPKTGEPMLNSGVLNELYSIKSSYYSIKKAPFIQQYVDEYINYIVRTNTNSSDSNIVKAKKLHDWLMNHTEYDYDSYESGSFRTDSSTEEWAPFLRKKSDGKYYAVCSGYAGAYKLLLNAAGVDCYYVSGDPLTGDGDGHAWNIVKINGNYYHVDATWDDIIRDHYKYFLRSDDIFASNHKFKWAGVIDDQIKDYETGVAMYDMRDLGDVNDDGEVTEDDALEIQKYLIKTKKELSDKERMRADINMDGEVKMNDAVSIKMALAKMKNSGYNKSVFEFIYIDGKMNV